MGAMDEVIICAIYDRDKPKRKLSAGSKLGIAIIKQPHRSKYNHYLHSEPNLHSKSAMLLPSVQPIFITDFQLLRLGEVLTLFLSEAVVDMNHDVSEIIHSLSSRSEAVQPVNSP